MARLQPAISPALFRLLGTTPPEISPADLRLFRVILAALLSLSLRQGSYLHTRRPPRQKSSIDRGKVPACPAPSTQNATSRTPAKRSSAGRRRSPAGRRGAPP